MIQEKNKFPKFMIMALSLSIFLFSICTGCIHERADPETGVQTWIKAVNDRNIISLYNLAPADIQRHVSKIDFIQEQESNPLLAQGNRIVNYTIMERSESESTAMFVVQLIMKTEEPGSSTPRYVPMYIRFNEYFEYGEWKVWTAAP